MGTTRNFLIKADLADAIYVALPVDKPKATQIVEDYIELIKEALEKEGKVVLAGFGTYEVKFKHRGRAGILKPGTRSSCGLARS